MKTNMKKMLLLCAVALLSVTARAQVVGGIVAGVSTGSVRITDLDNAFTDAIKGNDIIGFEGGLFMRARLGPFFVKPMALYNFRKGDVNYTVTSEGNAETTASFSLHKFSVPLLFGFQVLGPLFIEGGPVYNYLFSITDRYGNETIAVNNNGFGYRVGVGADFNKLLLYLNYSGAGYQSNSGKSTFREPYQLTFGIGLALGNGNITRPGGMRNNK